MLLAGKRLLITGVLTDQSIAFSVARLAIEEGATVVLTGFGRSLSLTNRIARRLPGEPPVIELDVTSEADLAALPARVLEHVDGLDGVLHAIGFAPADALGNGVLDTSWESVGTAEQLADRCLLPYRVIADPEEAEALVDGAPAVTPLLSNRLARTVAPP